MGSLFEQKGDKASFRLYIELYTFGSDNKLEKEALARNISTATITPGSFEKVWLKYIHSVKYACDYV